MNVRELNALLVAKCTGDEEVSIWHDGRKSPVFAANVLGKCMAVVQEGGFVCITDEMRANSTHELCIKVEGWDRVQ